MPSSSSPIPTAPVHLTVTNSTLSESNSWITRLCRYIQCSRWEVGFWIFKRSNVIAWSVSSMVRVWPSPDMICEATSMITDFGNSSYHFQGMILQLLNHQKIFEPSLVFIFLIIFFFWSQIQNLSSHVVSYEILHWGYARIGKHETKDRVISDNFQLYDILFYCRTLWFTGWIA